MADEPPPVPDTPPPPPVPESAPPPVAGGPSPFNVWMEKAGLPGKLLAFGGLGGVICGFLPLATLLGFSVMIVRAWQGIVGVLAYVCCIALAWLLFQPGPPASKKTLALITIIAAAVAALMALWMFFAAIQTIGIGAILNLGAAGAVVAGAFMVAKAEKVF